MAAERPQLARPRFLNITPRGERCSRFRSPPPPTMRGDLLRALASLSRVTSVRVAPFSSYLQTRYCVSAIAAICGRCVTQIT